MTSSAAASGDARGAAAPATEATSPGGRRGRRLVATAASLLGVVPFALLVTFFLAIPTLVVVIGSFLDADNRFTLANVPGADRRRASSRPTGAASGSPPSPPSLGAVFGALLAHAISTAAEGGILRRRRHRRVAACSRSSAA